MKRPSHNNLRKLDEGKSLKRTFSADQAQERRLHGPGLRSPRCDKKGEVDRLPFISEYAQPHSTADMKTHGSLMDETWMVAEETEVSDSSATPNIA